MQKLRFIKIGFVIFIFLIPSFYGFSDPIHLDLKHLENGRYLFSYEEHYFRGTGESKFSISKTSKGYTAVWDGITDTTKIYTDKKFNTQKIVFYNDITQLSARREAGLLLVSGTINEKKIDMSFKVGTKVWFQLLPFSLISFTVSDQKSLDFFLFDPYNLKIRDMRIEKKGVENITLFGKQHRSVKMAIRLKGFFSPFWKSEIWNDSVSGIQLRYEGLNVIPKLYKAEISLKKWNFIPDR